ncbi:MAG TPA: nucleotide exchange factor GrpE [Abditibacteriaceae bacterium]|nr:nucleotide exchange factor GrpE [Abditibacteriaceae bacterium]
MAEEQERFSLGHRWLRRHKSSPGAAPNATPPKNDAASKNSQATGAALAEVVADPSEAILGELHGMQMHLEQVADMVAAISERESSLEKVFNTLHTELTDYKNDFIYEHMKPVVRPLLFLYDSLEQFDKEVALYERPEERRQSGLAPSLVRENLAFFREQMVEALRICEVTLMDPPQGNFNPRLQKAVDVVPVDISQDNTILRVVRPGWFLNGQLLRPAEVIVGKAMGNRNK